jgi:NADPH-dependent 2,4-dienoyl-CoA reductase/sulfur reductase-like enzyme
MTDSSGRNLRDIVVVGGSVAGIRTAAALRRHGYDGHIRVLSAEAVPNYYRPALSKTFLAGDQDEKDLVLPLADDLGLDIWPGAEATSLDTQGKRLSVRRGAESVEIGYDGLVIATGLTPKRLPLPQLDGVHYLREVAEARLLRVQLDASPRVVVIGGGLIGCEVAATCRKLGLDVTIVEAAANLLEPVLGTAAGRLMTDLHRAHGVRVLTGAGVAGLAGHRQVESVSLSTGEQLQADVVVAAVGARPQTGWLEGSGLNIDDGVLCAANLGVLGTDDVVAVGDVARRQDPSGDGSVRIEHWENAVRQADTAARRLLHGPGTPPYAAQTAFWTAQYGLQLHVLGHPAGADALRVLEGELEELDGVAAYLRDGRVSAILALNRPHRLRAHRHLLPTTPPPGNPDPALPAQGDQR